MKPAETLVLTRNAAAIAPAVPAHRVLRNTYWLLSLTLLFSAGAAALAGRSKMIAALERLKAAYEPSSLSKQMTAFGISGGMSGGLKRLFASHPGLDERIAALRDEHV